MNACKQRRVQAHHPPTHQPRPSTPPATHPPTPPTHLQRDAVQQAAARHHPLALAAAAAVPQPAAASHRTALLRGGGADTHQRVRASHALEPASSREALAGTWVRGREGEGAHA